MHQKHSKMLLPGSRLRSRFRSQLPLYIFLVSIILFLSINFSNETVPTHTTAKIKNSTTTNSTYTTKLLINRTTVSGTPTTTATKCIPYVVPDTRPFFEREPVSPNSPQRISNLSDQDIFQQLSFLRLIVLATGRDVEGAIDKFRKHIEPIVDLFHPASRILICESDSKDKTVEKLYGWARAQVYTYGNMSTVYPERSKRIAFCRNQLLNLTYQMKSDYILHVDMDMFATNVRSFISNFRYNRNDWAAMTASTSGAYYDIWALRTLSDSILNFDVWNRVFDILNNNKTFCSQSVVDQIIGNNQKHIPVERGLVEVRSAFGGAGLYRSNMTYGCQYLSKGDVCEHVPFHLCIRKRHQGRIFINPEFTLD